MNLLHSLRLDTSNKNQVISFVGSGGKTTALFQLAKQFKSNVIVTTTTHLGAWQTSLADHHIVAKSIDDLKTISNEGIILITGEIENDRTKPISENTLDWLREYFKNQNIPLLIEADGSRQKPLKSPAEHEPPIPEFTDIVIYIT